MSLTHPSSTQRRGASHKPRRIRFLRMFYVKAAFYILLSLATFLLAAYAILVTTSNTSYVVVASFLILVLISNLLSKKFIQLLRRYGNQ